MRLVVEKVSALDREFKSASSFSRVSEGANANVKLASNLDSWGGKKTTKKQFFLSLLLIE